MEFLHQQCQLTLREGLEELYRHNPEVASVSKTKEKTFTDHDLTHIIFGCDTSITGEILLKPWILFGTDISMREVREYAADTPKYNN
jgi:ubiquinone biosynthesis protein Coq4